MCSGQGGDVGGGETPQVLVPGASREKQDDDGHRGGVGQLETHQTPRALRRHQRAGLCSPRL